MIAVVTLNSCVDRTLITPNLTTGSHCKAELAAETMAGKGMNVARILAQLDTPCALYGFVGADRFSSFDESLAEAGVINRLRPLPIRTRINTTLVDPEQQTETHIREAGDWVEPKYLDQLMSELKADLEAGDSLAFCGSLPPGVTTAWFGESIRVLAHEGTRVVVDASGTALNAAIRAGASLIKPNREELAFALGIDDFQAMDMPAAARALLEQNSDLAVLASDGAAGAYFASHNSTLHGLLLDNIQTVNTVGAGDALLAGFLTGSTIEESMTMALQAAAASVQTMSAGELDLKKMNTKVKLTVLTDVKEKK